MLSVELINKILNYNIHPIAEQLKLHKIFLYNIIKILGKKYNYHFNKKLTFFEKNYISKLMNKKYNNWHFCCSDKGIMIII